MDALDKHINELTKEDWTELYHNRGMSLPQLAKHFRVSTKPITERMDKFGVPRRGFGPRATLNIPEDLLVDLYVNQKMSATKIAKKLSCSDKSVRKSLEQYGLLRKRADEVLTFSYLEGCLSEGKNPRDISKESGYSVPVVYKFLHKLGFEVGPSRDKNLEFEA